MQSCEEARQAVGAGKALAKSRQNGKESCQVSRKRGWANRLRQKPKPHDGGEQRVVGGRENERKAGREIKKGN